MLAKAFVLLLSVFVVCLAMEHSCKWLLDVLEMLSESDGDQVFRLYKNVVHPGRDFFVRIRISCQNKVNPLLLRSLVYSGYTPVAKIEITKYGMEGIVNSKKILYAEGVLVQFNKSAQAVLPGNFLKLNDGDLTANIRDQNCTLWGSMQREEMSVELEENLSSPYCGESRLCNAAWLVPLYVEDATVLVKFLITNPGSIEMKSLFIHSSGFDKATGNTIGEHVTKLPSGYRINQSLVINCIALPVPFWVVNAIGNSDYCLYTDSDFERTSVIKVHNVSQSGRSKVCQEPCSSFEVKETLSLPDRILLSTCFGLQEIRATTQYHSDLILLECIRKIIAPPQSFPGTIKIIAIEDSSAQVYEADLSRGTSLHFLQFLDSENRTLCDFLELELKDQALSGCVIHDGSINSVSASHYVFLVSFKSLSEHSYFTVGYSDRKWKILFSFPTHLKNRGTGGDEHDHGEHWTILNSSISGQIRLRLSGLSFSRNTGDTLFLWGNVLLCSPNGGEDVLWLWDVPHDSNISVFASADDGSYAFLTDTQKVWWGHTGTGHVHLLEAAGQWNIGLLANQELPFCAGKYNILSLFFDAAGQLWKIIQCQNRTSGGLCIFRIKVAISDLLSHAQLIHEQTADDEDTTLAPSALENLFDINTGKRCLKFSMVFSADHSNYHTRHIIRMVDLPHLVNTVPVSLSFLGDYLENKRSAMRGDDTVDVSEIKDTLPAYIYLNKGDYYSFEVTMTLDSVQQPARTRKTTQSFPVGLEYTHEIISRQKKISSVYWSSFDNLVLSYKVSDSVSLNVTVARRVFIHKRTVRYQISVQDSGLSQKQNAPGVGLRPVDFGIQPWQADETCFVKKTEKGVLRGTQSMTVLLGCPPGIKIVFDSQATTNASKKNQFCDPKQGISCFLFEHTFYPVFNLLDQATGNTTTYTGLYRLAIVGGGKKHDSVEDYSEGDKALYNYKSQGSSSTLIWTPTAKSLGSIPIFNISTNGLQWLCGRKTPCAQITPVFPHSPEFFFKLEFSNRDVGDTRSYCDLTAQFIIRIHGLPLGSLYPATVIVVKLQKRAARVITMQEYDVRPDEIREKLKWKTLSDYRTEHFLIMSCIAIIACYVLTMYAFKRNDHRLWNVTRDFVKSKREKFRYRLRKTFRRNNVVGVLNQCSVEDYDTEAEVKKEM